VSKIVLVIDDDPIFMEMTASLLTTQREVTVLRAVNGMDAIGHIDAAGDTISLIICDLNMPERDGIEVILELGRRRIKTPVVLVTGAVPSVVKSAEMLARAHSLNVLNLLIKPVHFRQLSATLDAALAA
jgi:DNA-binding NtrC family response regulator